MGSGTSSTQAGAQGLQHLVWTEVKVSLETEALGFPGSAGDQSQNPCSWFSACFQHPCVLFPCPQIPRMLWHLLLLLTDVWLQSSGSSLAKTFLPFLIHSSVPSSVTFGILQLWLLFLHPFQTCLRSGSKQRQKLLSPSGIFSGKREKSVPKPGAGKSKSFCWGQQTGGAHQAPSSITAWFRFKGSSGGLRTIPPAPGKANPNVRDCSGHFVVKLVSLQSQMLSQLLSQHNWAPFSGFNHPYENILFK